MHGGTGAQGAVHDKTSALLLAAVSGEQERITVGEIAGALDARAFGLSTLLFSIPSLLPMPPGLPTVVGVALLIGKTRLGLFVRAVTQNRPIASCMGVNTDRVDTYAFALGSGIAGLAGCALSQVGNVGPDLGQSYIVDAFMVVVLGGVGQLAGTVIAALGLGVLNKFLEGLTGAVLAKIAVLVFIVIFIQKRPQGIFAMKGRSAEA